MIIYSNLFTPYLSLLDVSLTTHFIAISAFIHLILEFLQILMNERSRFRFNPAVGIRILHTRLDLPKTLLYQVLIVT